MKKTKAQRQSWKLNFYQGKVRLSRLMMGIMVQNPGKMDVYHRKYFLPDYVKAFGKQKPILYLNVFGTLVNKQANSDGSNWEPRPFLTRFLTEASRHYEIVLLSSRGYEESLLFWWQYCRKYCDVFFWNELQEKIKDLRPSWSKKQHMFIVDDDNENFTPESLQFLVPISTFTGEKKDKCLHNVLDTLKQKLSLPVPDFDFPQSYHFGVKLVCRPDGTKDTVHYPIQKDQS